MKKEIENLQLPNTSIKQARKLSSTIRIFDVGDIEDTDISETIEEITGAKPILITSRISTFTKRRNVTVRLTKEQYYKLIEKSPERLLVEYLSYRYEKFLSVRMCTVCKCLGHTKDYCKLDDKLKPAVTMCEEKRVCASCVLKEVDKISILERNLDKAIDAAVKKVKHSVFGNACTEYQKQLKNVEKLYDF